MQSNQRELFGRLYEEYIDRNIRFQGENQRGIREVCAKARAWTAAPRMIGTDAIDLLVWRAQNGIARVGLGGVARQARRVDRDSFIPIVSDMLGKAASASNISKAQYVQWRDDFFHIAGYNANAVFNRLVFSCFPEQFCSVINKQRLCNICAKLREVGCAIPEANIEEMDWFDLCEFIVPIVREAFPEKDYADRSVFLAAIGVEQGH